MSGPLLHVHVWKLDSDNSDPIAEIDLPLTGVYDDHIQFAGTVENRHLEIRMWFKDLPTLVKEGLEQIK